MSEEEPQPAGTLTVLGSKETGTADSLRDAMKTLTELRETTTSVRGVKRTLEDCEDDADRRKIQRNEAENTSAVSVPPVKLRRRSPKRFLSVRDDSREQDELASKAREDAAERETEGESREQESLAERVNSSEDRNVARRSEVEIRLCDSSTDEDQTQVERSEEGKTLGVYAVEDSKEIVASCDSLNVPEEDYLTLDMASDDILKDIDALLKEKSSV